MAAPGKEELLNDACRAWQSGRNKGSSRLRGAARVLTGHAHYFDADFIRAQEDAAREDPECLKRARALLDAIANSCPREAAEWRGESGSSDDTLAGRGLAPKPQDEDILRALDSGEIVMPLWGVSLDREIAESYGRRFLFLISGPFRGVAAWRASGEKPEEQEIITGGRYEVVETRSGEHGNTLVAVLREAAPITPPSTSRPPGRPASSPLLPADTAR